MVRAFSSFPLFSNALGDADRIAQGYTHVIGFVAAENLAQLRTMPRRDTWERIGRAAYFVWGRHVWCVRSGAVERTGFRFVAAPRGGSPR